MEPDERPGAVAMLGAPALGSRRNASASDMALPQLWGEGSGQRDQRCRDPSGEPVGQRGGRHAANVAAGRGVVNWRVVLSGAVPPMILTR